MGTPKMGVPDPGKEKRRFMKVFLESKGIIIMASYKLR